MDFPRQPVTQRRFTQRRPVLPVELCDVAEAGCGIRLEQIKFVRLRELDFLGKLFPVVFAVTLGQLDDLAK